MFLIGFRHDTSKSIFDLSNFAEHKSIDFDTWVNWRGLSSRPLELFVRIVWENKQIIDETGVAVAENRAITQLNLFILKIFRCDVSREVLSWTNIFAISRQDAGLISSSLAGNSCANANGRLNCYFDTFAEMKIPPTRRNCQLTSRLPDWWMQKSRRHASMFSFFLSERLTTSACSKIFEKLISWLGSVELLACLGTMAS